MPNTKSAKKRMKQNEARRAKNRSVRSALKTQLKKVRAAVEAKDLKMADDEARVAGAKLDRAAAQGVIHKNSASRSKSRLQHLIVTAKGK